MLKRPVWIIIVLYIYYLLWVIIPPKGTKMLILASQSPRRRELLSNAGFEFECIPSDEDEGAVQFRGDAAEYTRALALLKARSVFDSHPGDTVIGSDTVVEAGGAILGKPCDDDDAARMLRMLSGKTHTVHTGAAILRNGHSEVFSVSTEVEFYPLSEDEIAEYVASGEPRDKAGAYGIQGKGAALVKRINGDFFTVMGFPIAEVVRRLRRLGIYPTRG